MEKEILIEAERLIKEKKELISSKCVCKELKKKFKKDDVKSCKKKIKKLFENEQVTFFFFLDASETQQTIKNHFGTEHEEFKQ